MSSEEQNAAASSSSADQNGAAAPPNPRDFHKLNSAWSLWYLPEARVLPGQPQPEMKDLLKKADSFETAEEFWSVYNALPPADKLTVGEQFMFFRNPVKPEWEDPAFARGEMFTVWTDHVDAADKFIQTMLAGMLGESFTVDRFGGKQGVLAGLRFSSRTRKQGRQWKLDVWTTETGLHTEVDALVKQTCDKCGIRGAQIFSQEFQKKM
jgi:hypothetical protein